MLFNTQKRIFNQNFSFGKHKTDKKKHSQKDFFYPLGSGKAEQQQQQNRLRSVQNKIMWKP